MLNSIPEVLVSLNSEAANSFETKFCGELRSPVAMQNKRASLQHFKPSATANIASPHLSEDPKRTFFRKSLIPIVTGGMGLMTSSVNFDSKQ